MERNLPEMEDGVEPPSWARNIRRRRQSRAWSQCQLAAEVNRLDPQARVDSNTVSRWERGVYKPSPFYIRLLCRCLEATPLELGLLESDEDGNGSVGRRDFLSESIGLSALAAVIPAPPGAWERIEHAATGLGPIPVDDRTADSLESVTMGLERLDQQIAPAALIGPAVGHLETLMNLLKGSMASTVRRRVCSIAAETAGLVSFLKTEAGDSAGGAIHFRVAVDAAREAGDRALGAFMVGYYTAIHRGYLSDARLRLRRFTEGDLGFAVSELSPTGAMYFAARAADVYASL
jgi:transcriptional regulator with XRE-family HTH domain